MSNTTPRRFNVGDPVMMSEARSFLHRLIQNLATFAGFDAETFVQPFCDEMQQRIDTAEAMPSDDVLIDIQAQETRDVNEEMAESGLEIRYTYYFVKKVFRDNTPVLNEFGYNDYADARFNADKLILFLSDFIRTVEKYLAKLETGGYPATRLDTLKTCLAELKEERREQKDCIKERPVKTAERVKVLNSIWDFMVMINDAAEFVYMDNPEMLELFTLPRNEGTGSEEPALEE